MQQRVSYSQRISTRIWQPLKTLLKLQWRSKAWQDVKHKTATVIQEFVDTGRLPLFNVISIETSERCNRRCTFCPNSVYKQGNGFMPLELFHKIVLELAEAGYCSTVVMHLYNEPLLDKRLPSLISFARKHLPDATIMFATNGDRLTLDLWKTVRQNGLDYAIIGQYDGIIQPNIQKIQDALSDSERAPFQVRVSSDLTSTRGGLVNVESIPEAALLECCARPFFQLTIRHSGLAVICCEDYLSEVVLGDAGKQSIVDIWTGDKANEIRLHLAKKNRSVAKACAQCNTSYEDSVQKCHFLGQSRRFPPVSGN